MKRIARKALAMVLSIALLFSCLLISGSAEVAKIGIIYGLSSDTMNLRLRSGAGTSFSQVTLGNEKINLHNGNEVTIHEELPSADTDAGKIAEYPTWYKISFDWKGTAVEGYVPQCFVRIKEQLGEITEDFEEMIAPFPESYKESLRQLHLYYPEWKFIPMQINMEWDKVISEESVPHSNYVDISSPESHRSTEPGSYDWTTDTWIKYSGGSRYNASEAIIKYYMDPRNFLDEKYIFQFESLSYNADLHTIEGVEKMISKINFMKDAKIKNEAGEEISYAQAYIDAAKKTGVSPYHLVARTRQEVGVNGSGSTSGTVEGYEGIYNFYNIGATGTLNDGLKWASDPEKKGDWGRPWNSQYKSIVNGADWIGSGYINKGQNTLYFEKFAVVGNGLFYHQYMQTITAPYYEAATIYNTYSEMDVLNSSFCFVIPIYNNMPEEKCEKPTGTGSPNNWLKSLEVEGYSITPSFEINGSTNYSLIVEKDVAEVKIKAAAVSDHAVIIDGASKTVQLAEGSNRVKIKVKAGNGDIKTYVLIIVRGEATELPPDEEDPPVVESGYNITFPNADGKISGIAVGATLSDIKAGLGLYGEAGAAFFAADGSAIEDLAQTAATGMKVQITAGTTDSYTLLIYGDANGDGAVDAIDLLMLRRNILKTYELQGVYYSAADCNKDGEVDAVDLLMVRRHILQTYTIEQ